MTLNEAIKHAEEVAEEKEKEGKLLYESEAAIIGCLKCAGEHRQLAEWLKDYKRLLEQESVLDKIRAEIEQIVKPDELDCRGNGKSIRYGLCIALDIIDKYKAEGSDKEENADSD